MSDEYEVVTSPSGIDVTVPRGARIEFHEIRLEVVSALTGVPLVDLSIDYEPWLVRGDQ